MKVITRYELFDKSKYRPLAVAVGNYDGFHLGHREIVRTIQHYAVQKKMDAAVFTFRNHPQHVLHGKVVPVLLTSFHQKLSLFQQAGVQLCFAQEFTEEFSEIGPEDFLKQVLVETLGAKAVCMGFNARFGFARAGDVSMLKKLSSTLGYEFLEPKQIQIDGMIVSSTSVRTLIKQGQLEKAAQLLNRRFSFRGTVISGDHRGKKLGFPTANIETGSTAMPPEGVYAVLCRLICTKISETSDHEFDFQETLSESPIYGALNYGTRPTFGENGKPVAEVHLLDFQGDLLGREVEVEFISKIRNEVRFTDESALIHQIQKDIEEVKKAFVISSGRT